MLYAELQIQPNQNTKRSNRTQERLFTAPTK